MADDIDTGSGRKSSIQKTITEIYNGLSNVSVVTAVADPMVNLSTEKGKIVVDISSKTDVKAFITQINLVDGDVISTLPTDYGDHHPVLEMHTRQVAASVEVLPNNIRTLARVASEIIDIVKD